jgi:hypothetical protein
VAVPVGPVGGQERAEVQLVDHVQHEPGQMVGRQPVAQVRWEQKALVTVAGQEVVGNGRSYLIALLGQLLIDKTLSTNPLEPNPCRSPVTSNSWVCSAGQGQWRVQAGCERSPAIGDGPVREVVLDVARKTGGAVKVAIIGTGRMGRGFAPALAPSTR